MELIILLKVHLILLVKAQLLRLREAIQSVVVILLLALLIFHWINYGME